MKNLGADLQQKKTVFGLDDGLWMCLKKYNSSLVNSTLNSIKKWIILLCPFCNKIVFVAVFLQISYKSELFFRKAQDI
jgi:hypothetical protein